MIYSPDVNVWIALTSNRHVHHAVATEWLQGIEQDYVAFCRVSELGFLRLWRIAMSWAATFFLRPKHVCL